MISFGEGQKRRTRARTARLSACIVSVKRSIPSSWARSRRLLSSRVPRPCPCQSSATTDRRRLRGEKTRASILSHAARVASAEGLEAVSLQRLADDLGISKSGLFAHFGSKEELQLATVEEAGRIFTEEVLRPGLKPPAGLGRLWALSNAYLS